MGKIWGEEGRTWEDFLLESNRMLQNFIQQTSLELRLISPHFGVLLLLLILTLYAFQKMSCIDIKLKDIHKVVLYFGSLRIYVCVYIYIYIYIYICICICIYNIHCIAPHISKYQN